MLFYGNTYLLREGKRKGKEEGQYHQLTHSLDSTRDLVQEEPLYSGVTRGFRNLTTVINLSVWRNTDLSQFECVKSLQCQNTFALLFLCAKPLSGLLSDMQALSLRRLLH